MEGGVSGRTRGEGQGEGEKVGLTVPLLGLLKPR